MCGSGLSGDQSRLNLWAWSVHMGGHQGWEEKREWAPGHANIGCGPGSRYQLFFRRHPLVSFYGCSLCSANRMYFQNNLTVTLGKMVKLVKISFWSPLFTLYASHSRIGDFFPTPQSHQAPMFSPGCSYFQPQQVTSPVPGSLLWFTSTLPTPNQEV